MLGALLTLNVVAQDLEFDWAVSMGGYDRDVGSWIASDGNGNIYTIGHFIGTVDFDPGTGVTNLSSNGEDDIFIQKLDPDGNLLWVKQMGGTARDWGLFITLDTYGNIYTTGLFGATVDFDPGTGTFNLTSNGSSDAFIQKLDPEGNFLWVKQIRGPLQIQGRSIAIDIDDNILTTGYFWGTADFDPGTGTFNLSSNGECDNFIQKLDSDGNFQWAKQIGGSSFDEGGRSVTTDNYGNVYTTGNFAETVDFDPGPGIIILTSNAWQDAFIQKLDPDGNFLWVKQMGGSQFDNGLTVTIDAGENIITAGYFGATVDFDPGPEVFNLTSNGGNDIFIQKLDPDGNFLWAKQMGGPSTDFGRAVTDADGNVFTTGMFRGTVDFDPGPGIVELESYGDADQFIQKLDPDGNFLWVKQTGGLYYMVSAYSITLDINENVLTTGSFTGTADFDPDTSIYNLTSLGNEDIFVFKLTMITTEIIENKFENNITIYPNPTKGKLFIDFENVYSDVIIELRDLAGKLVYSDKISDTNLVEININEPAGLYFVTISSEKMFVNLKLIIN